MFLNKNILLSTVLISSLGVSLNANEANDNEGIKDISPLQRVDKKGLYVGAGLIILSQKTKVTFEKKEGAPLPWNDINRLSTQFAPYLTFGRAIYFDNAQEHGLKIAGYLGSSFVNTLAEETNFGHKPVNNKDTKTSLDYFNLKFGLDIRYNWDFVRYNMGNNVWDFGMDVGAIFEMNYYRLVSIKRDNKSISAETQKTLKNEIDKARNIFTFTHGIQPLIGFHWTINNRHIISTNYTMSFIDSAKYEYTAPAKSINEKTGKVEEGTEVKNIKASIITSNYLYLSYAYKF